VRVRPENIGCPGVDTGHVVIDVRVTPTTVPLVALPREGRIASCDASRAASPRVTTGARLSGRHDSHRRARPRRGGNHQPLYDENLARGTPTPPEGWIDRDCIARINSLCERTGARIVISSSWRTYETIRGQPVGGLVGTVAVLRACGLTAEVIGATPDHATPEQRERHERADRWPEIHAWLREHSEVGAWVVLDDSELPGVPAAAFVRTDIAVGITDADVERAVSVLSAPAVTFDRP
jgi:hypothetical protein